MSTVAEIRMKAQKDAKLAISIPNWKLKLMFECLGVGSVTLVTTRELVYNILCDLSEDKVMLNDMVSIIMMMLLVAPLGQNA